jgi:hypothetical protein
MSCRISGSWRNWGCGTTANTLTVTSLACGATYYWRVWAAGLSGSGYSDYAPFTTDACPVSFTPPFNPHVESTGEHTAALDWIPGQNNHFFWADIALSRSDLLNRVGSWRNFSCGTTRSDAEVFGLDCNTTYYWRVWAVGDSTVGYSDVDTFKTQNCPVVFTAPYDLRATPSVNTAQLSWKAGRGNVWYCVDLAQSHADLVNLTGTWQNFACGSMATSLSIPDKPLHCNTTYYWRVYASGVGLSGYSEEDHFKTLPCS